jgi:hypothetical protein
MPMSDRKYTGDRRGRDDDMPIIGDFSAASDFGPRPASPPPAVEQPASAPPAPTQRSASRAAEPLRPDPRDMARYARRNRGRERRSPLGAALRSAAALLVAVAVGVGVYLNYEPLRGRAVEWLALARSSATAPVRTGASSSPDSPETIVVEPPAVVGTPEASVGERAAEAPPSEARAPAAAPSAQTPPEPAVDRALPDAAAPAPEPSAQPPDVAAPDAVAAALPPAEPPAPPAPETFEFATQIVSVSERQAGAAVVVRRAGGTLAESSVVWWTSGGTAVAGSDFADLGALVERFAAGEKTRTIHVPIVGDSAPETSETFYVNLGEPGRAGDASVEPVQRVEVVIEDDD